MKAVAGIVAEAALSSAFDALFNKLSSQEVLKYACINNVESDVNQCSKLLNKLKCVLDDAEERQMSEGHIKLWVDDLRDLAYDVEDILDDFSYEVLRQKVTAETEASTSKVRKLIHISYSFLSPRVIKFNPSFGWKMKEINQRFEAITKEKENLRLTESVTEGSKRVARERLETTCLIQESQVYGRKKDKETLVNELLSSGKPISVVAIVGMGGLGKTTLAQLVYNEETVDKSFDIKAWVCVSDEFDVFKISVKILDSFTSSTCDMKDLNSVQTKLKDVLHGKKFLLVLDDVWNENYLQWDALIQPLAASGLGSNMLITTRSEKVASTAGAGFMHHLKKLNLEECLPLLALHTFGVESFNGHPSLQEVGKEIAKKCDGLPLAAKAIGGLLRGDSDPTEWRRVLNSNMWDLPRDRCPILPALLVSYHYLPSHLKRCFAYCAMFPKDYEFDKDDLILWWMAQGFLEQSKLFQTNFTQVGNKYFNDLSSRSFFQPSDSRFVMHDLVHDLAMWVSGGLCLHLPTTYEDANCVTKLGNPRHLSFMSREYEVAKRFEKFPISMQLRTFIALNLKTSYDIFFLNDVILDRVIPKMRCLKLLCLRDYLIEKLPNSICKLKHLRHLDMSFTAIKILPESMCDLLNLQVLKLCGCKSLIQLPGEIGKLANLRLLDSRGTDKLQAMPPGIGRLKNLQILSKFIVEEKHGLRLNELKDLSLLEGELSIWGLEKVLDVQEARDANLKAKEGLVSLEFKWKWMEETSAIEKEKQVQILDELQPHTSPTSLQIDGYNGKHFPEWVGNCRFTNLETLSLRDCKSASSLPPLGGMCSLKMLEIDGMDEVKKLGREFLGNTSNSNNTFPSLETLILKDMNGLEEWCSCFKRGVEVVFPRLRKMEISNCPVLVGKLPNQLPMLEELSICGCPNLRNFMCSYPSLLTLVVENCSIAALKTLGGLTSLRSLQLTDIRELTCMDDELLSMLGALQELEIIRCRQLQSLVRNGREIEGMAGLQSLTIRNCDELVIFGPMRLSSSLMKMEISDCKALEWLPEGFMMDGSSSFGPMRLPSSLRVLHISTCPSITSFPRGRFPNLLMRLEIRACENLKSLPKLSNSIKVLIIDHCDHLQCLPRFPASIVRLKIENLKSLALERTATGKSTLIYSNTKNVQHQSSSLECTEISNVEDLESESEKMFDECSFSLEKLVISGFNLRRLPENITSFQRIKKLEINCCENLRWLPNQMKELNCLRELKIYECRNLELLVGQDLPQKLEHLWIKDCEKVIQALFAGGLSSLVSLTRLTIDGGSRDINIEQETPPVFLPKLQRLRMANFGNVESLAAAFQLPSSIQELRIYECANLQELPILELSSNLGYLRIKGCPLLKKRCLDRKGEYWPLLSIIPRIVIDKETSFDQICC